MERTRACIVFENTAPYDTLSFAIKIRSELKTLPVTGEPRSGSCPPSPYFLVDAQGCNLPRLSTNWVCWSYTLSWLVHADLTRSCQTTLTLWPEHRALENASKLQAFSSIAQVRLHVFTTAYRASLEPFLHHQLRSGGREQFTLMLDEMLTHDWRHSSNLPLQSTQHPSITVQRGWYLPW